MSSSFMDDNDSDEVNKSDSSHEEFIETLARKRIWRQRITADDFWKSSCGILLRNPKVADPTSFVQKKIKLRLIY